MKPHKPLPFWSTSTHQPTGGARWASKQVVPEALRPLATLSRLVGWCLNFPRNKCHNWIIDWICIPWRWTARTWSHDGLVGRWFSEIPGGVFSGEAAVNLLGCIWIYLDLLGWIHILQVLFCWNILPSTWRIIPVRMVQWWIVPWLVVAC